MLMLAVKSRLFRVSESQDANSRRLRRALSGSEQFARLFCIYALKRNDDEEEEKNDVDDDGRGS